MGTSLDPLAQSWIEERKKEHKSHSHFQAMERRPLSLADEDPFAFPGYGRRIPPSLPDEETAQKPFALPGISTANLKSDLVDVRIRMHRRRIVHLIHVNISQNSQKRENFQHNLQELI
jgi:hypothetical protein